MKTRQAFNEYLSCTHELLKSVNPVGAVVPENFRNIKPWRVLKTINIRPSQFTAERLAHGVTLDATILGFGKMYTLVLVPQAGLPAPVFSVDVMLMGKSRMFVIEIIDPTGDSFEAWDIAVNHLITHQKILATREQRPITEWQKPLQHSSSLHLKTTAEDDALLLEVFGAYLNTYVEFVQNQEPTACEINNMRRATFERYVDDLLTRGGPAVDGFKMIVGETAQRMFVHQVMFGLG
jgi:hypothetical protein